ncbi:mediator of RNA polymerase II transcription subunit 15a-like isoform X2 [Prunus avium]|uniref:Mediator of RNA polymerase II transcription subunit 15a-like isoform X2 n=1 Tax=Prunus avium TaxID=42229 RepID=A0A6P5SV88_PRUAV|nr:mediator of RNA polymerase II transcription subunit 15a-like isoform X2 [Prunus avium]
MFFAGSFLTELVPIFLDQSSEAPARHANGADWQEEVYQTIKLMKQAYVPELSELHQKIATGLQQFDSLPQQPKSEQLGKLKMSKTNLEHLISVLQISKSSISPDLKDKLVLYEKQIVNFINVDRGGKPVSSLQQVQLLTPQPMQQSLSEITQQQFYGRNPQLQSMNLQGSVAIMQQNNMTSLQQMSSSSEVSTAQQRMMHLLQPSSNIESGQGFALNSLQQFALGSVPQTLVSASQEADMTALSSQSGDISSEWTFLMASFVLEILSAACEQLSSRNKPLYALGGMLFAIAAFLTCIWELVDKVIKDRIVLRRREMLRIPYYPSPHNTPGFNLADYYGLAGAFYQLFCATFEWFHVRKGVDNPIKFSIMPLVFLVLLACSRVRVERYTIDETLVDIV